MSRHQDITRALRFTLHLMWTEADGYSRRNLTLSFGLLVMFSVMSALAPVVFKLVIDLLSGQGPVMSSATLALLAAYILCQLVLHVSGDVRGYVHGLGAQRLARRIGRRLFAHIVRLPLRYHLDRQTGAIGQMISQGLSGCQTILQHLVFTFMPVIVEFLAITLVLVHFEHPAYLLILGPAALAYGLVFWRGAVNIQGPAHASSAAQIETQAMLTDSLLNYESVKYFGAEGAICDRFDGMLARTEHASRGVLRLRMVNGLAATGIFIVSLTLAVGCAGYEVLRGTMTIGDFVLISGYVGRLVQPLETIGVAARDLSQALAFLQRMLGILEERTEVGSDERPSSHAVARGALTFDKVSFSYEPGRSILERVSFTVPAGHTLGIVGMSGSGKSSLIRLLFRLYEPDAGLVLLEGVPITAMPLSRLRRAISVVPQDTVLFNESIGYNIAFGRPGASLAEVEAAAKLARLDTFIESLPERYATRVGERGLKLSGGEKQRVAIARAALKRPAIFLFDEATSSLDTNTEREILANLIDVTEGCTTVIVAHRLSTVAHAHEILVLDRGVVTERGTHAVLLERGGAYAAMWIAQHRGRDDRRQAATSVA